jgi:predicted MFS family arabinose efflux permease
VIWLTIIGAFSSPVFLPLTAWLAHEVGWRDTLRVEAVINLVTFLVAAALTRAGRAGGAAARASRHQAREALRGAWRVAAFRRWVIASVVSGAAIDILLVNQVPAMIAAGLSTGAAATIGGLRGLSQLAGRIPMSPLLRRLGAWRTVIATFLLGVVGACLLQFSGQIAPAILYSVCAGASIGAVFTLQGIYTHELIGAADLGLVMGAQQAVFAVGGAIGPAVAGVLLQTTGSYTVIITLTAVCFAVAAATIAAGSRASPSIPERRAGQANQPASSSSASGST